MSTRITTLTLTALMLLLLAGPEPAEAQLKEDLDQAQTQIGFVDPLTVLQSMPKFAAVQKELQNFQQRKQEEMAEKEQEFQNAISAYQEKSAVISEEARAREEERLGELSANLQQFEQQISQEIAQKQQELYAPLLEEVQGAIDTVSQEMELDMVVNTRTSQGDMILLYASPEMREQYDITDRVMRELGI